MDTGKIRLTTLLATIGTVLLVEVAGRTAVTAGGAAPPTVLLWVRTAETLLLLLVVRMAQRSLVSVGLGGKDDLIRGLKGGLAWAVVFGGLAAAAGAMLLAAGKNPLLMFRMHIAGGMPLFLYFLTGAVVSPFVEELVFRGVLYGYFRRLGVAAGIVLSTAVFAGLHLSGPALPVTQAVGGIVFCLAYEKEKSLLAPYVVHALGNTAIFTLGLLG